MHIYYPWCLNAIFRLGQYKSEEDNKKWIISLKEDIPKKFGESGFNTVVLPSTTYGARYFVTSKKYPNLYTLFEISLDKVTSNITWNYYVNNDKGFEVSFPLTQILTMIGVMPNKTKRRFTIFKKNKQQNQDSCLTIDMFEYVIETMISKNNIELNPFHFLYESKNDSNNHVKEWIGSDSDWFNECFERYYFTIENGSAVKHLITINQLQHKLLCMFRNKILL